jgi:tripartite motif-containing protein 71
MKRVVFFLAAPAAFAAWGEWVFEGRWGSYGSGERQFDSPYGIAVGPYGDVYVADSGNDRVSNFTANGSFGGKVKYSLKGPMGVAVAPDGRLFIADTLNHRVVYRDDRGFYKSWGSYGHGNGLFCYPYGVAVSRYYVV